MKFFVAFLLGLMVALCSGEEQTRDKRGVLAYSAPYVAAPYTAPVVASPYYTYPYAYSAYSAYPYAYPYSYYLR